MILIMAKIPNVDKKYLKRVKNSDSVEFDKVVFVTLGIGPIKAIKTLKICHTSPPPTLFSNNSDVLLTAKYNSGINSISRLIAPNDIINNDIIYIRLVWGGIL